VCRADTPIVLQVGPPMENVAFIGNFWDVRPDGDDDPPETVTVTAEASLSAIAGRGSSATSACGLCGRLDVTTLDSSPALATSVETPMVSAATLVGIPEHLRRAQTAFTETGGLHAAGLCRADGTLLLVREDVGRHNALDKLIGALVTQGADLNTGALLITSRASYEMVQKAAIMNIGLVAAISAPTSFAVSLAESAGVTLIGFMRDHAYVIYTHPERLES
jgi:FdhD protein